MDEDSRTLWCGNLSDRVTEEILYELFLQGGPIQKVSIPKDRNGKQRTYGFVTFKHIDSVAYALDLFDGTTLFDRTLSMKKRNTTEMAPVHTQSQEQAHNHLLQLGNQMLLGNLMQDLRMQMYNVYVPPGIMSYPSQMNTYPGSDDRRSQRPYPYQREYEQDRHSHNRSHRSHRDRQPSDRGSNYFRHNNNSRRDGRN
ncbi:splicing regulator RBM11 [Cephus cinctus]|uniref:Splicing regulator RBM11 n=1 Tax=Cephus cinctus TaxID=211228 RepID=A0AAJ7C0Z5_CEPCN|nr:splicing regulator RBM11 [Cephus cinctus]